ncbi:hypothetical protein [Streptomyces sp. NPDC059016]|uniref:hypothetical protein n=1 Tax=Streptomyces sp. NPDC059016 TaxID=3346699 RepID=UPI0036C48F15
MGIFSRKSSSSEGHRPTDREIKDAAEAFRRDEHEPGDRLVRESGRYETETKFRIFNELNR